VTREESSSSSSGNQQRQTRPRRLSLIFGSFNEAMFPRRPGELRVLGRVGLLRQPGWT
jgi:hypothetical protein